MDGSAPLNSRANEGLNKEKSLNDLPADIVGHILSFLETKQAVQTSVLSKKWQYLWTSIPDLNFILPRNSSRKVFMNFVDRALLLRSSSSSHINEFSISFNCDVLDDASLIRIQTWVYASLRHKLNHLSVEIPSGAGPLVLPREVFICETLTKLDIRMSCDLRLPSKISLSCLTTLYLSKVVLKDENLTQQLFSLPSIKELRLYQCDWSNLGAVSISAPKLQRLAIYCDPCRSFDSHCCQVMIFGTGLTDFSCYGFTNDYWFCNSSPLVEARIHAYYCDGRSRSAAYHFYKLVEGLSSTVENLTLTGAEVLNQAVELFPRLPIFINLTSLHFSNRVTNAHSRMILGMVSNSPRLQLLTFKALSSSCQLDNWILEPVPPCFQTFLKTIEIGEFCGSDEEFDVVKMFLETMEIFCPNFHDIGYEAKVHERLHQLPRLSKTCKFNLFLLET